MISLRYKGKFRNALYYLAVGEGDVRARLRRAYFQINSLREDEVPQDIRQEWVEIVRDLTARGALIESGIALKSDLDNTLDRMKNRTARKIAERIYRVSVDIQ